MTPNLLALTAGGLVDDVGRSLKEGFFMFFETFWALVLGFGLSGAVQAFVSRETMQLRLGNHRPAAVARASFYGMASSSCSYAASAMAKSLFQKGADFVASMVFMFASTNLVIELGIVLVVLIGWQFMAAEFVGGAIMIALLTLTGGLFLRGRALEQARRRVEITNVDHVPSESSDDRRPLSERLSSLSGWSDSASYTMADLTMLRREMLVGYGVAGFLAVLVPTYVWNDVFIQGHGFATTLENVAVGPFIAIISFVCSIGNVPLAAALWTGGISFGGVVSFIFADLIAMPLLLVYRKLYGTRMTLRMLGLFWALMSTAGLATEGIFRAAGLAPTTRPTTIVVERFSWNYTSILNLIFLAVFGGLYLLAHKRERLGGGAGYAIDPVCGMQVERAHAPATFEHEGSTIYFCSDHCRERFAAAPSRFVNAKAELQQLTKVAERNYSGTRDDADRDWFDNFDRQTEEEDMPATIDPVCGMTVDPATAAAVRSYDGVNYFFCNPGCAETFDADPDRYTTTKN